MAKAKTVTKKGSIPVKKNAIGLDPEKSSELATKLDQLLADYQLFYINTRGFHWNITGEKFFELHVKFEQLYNDIALKIDEVAERIRTLGNVPKHSFSDYLKDSQIKAITNVSDGKQAIKHILDAFTIILTQQRELLDLSEEANDEGTNSLMSDYIRAQEKMVWMYSAYMK